MGPPYALVAMIDFTVRMISTAAYRQDIIVQDLVSTTKLLLQSVPMARLFTNQNPVMECVQTTVTMSSVMNMAATSHVGIQICANMMKYYLT